MGQDLIATPGCTLFGSRLFYERRRFFDEAQEFLRSTVDVMLGNSLLTVQSPSDWQLSVVLIVQVRWLFSVDPDTAQLRYDRYG